MVAISEIVDVTITVQSSGVTRKGFNSLMIIGEAGDFGGGFNEYEVRRYTTFEGFSADVTAGDIVAGDLTEMVQVAFAQSPAVPEVYISRIDAASGSLSSTDLDSVAANNNDWFGLCHTRLDSDDNITAASWVAANKKYGFWLQEDFVDQAMNSNFNAKFYNDNTANTGTARWVQCGLASRILALIPGSYTAAFKQLELIGPSKISSTNETTLRDQDVNQYSTTAGRDFIWNGIASGGGFIDTYIGVLYLEARIEEDVFAVLLAREKVPFTNDGINLIAGAVQNRLNQSIEEGYLTDDPPPVVDAPLAQEVSDTDKSNRILTNVSFEAVTAGAIHQVRIRGIVIA